MIHNFDSIAENCQTLTQKNIETHTRNLFYTRAKCLIAEKFSSLTVFENFLDAICFAGDELL